MGVRMLNRYLKEYCPGAIKEIPLSNLKNKRIAIDVSIFLYQFRGEDALLEMMTKMINLFRDNYIVPIFVFDGEPPEAKNEALSERDETKKKAKTKCDELEKQLNDSESDEEKKRLENLLKEERKKCIRITNANIRDVKALIDVLGVNYLEAEGEADELCAYLVNKKLVWACMSEDMDMFVYGCSRVLRNFQLSKNTCTLYSSFDILKELKMTMNEFRQVCLLAGTDYNKSRFTIFTTMGFFYKYLRKKRPGQGFYDWLIHIKTIDEEYKINLKNSSRMFQLQEVDYDFSKSKGHFMNKRILNEEVNDFLEKHNINNLLNVYT